MINSFTFTLPVKIIQLWVNIILGGVYKMLETIGLILASILIVCLVVVSYLLGKQHGIEDMQTRIRNIYRDSAKLAEEHFTTTWKT